MVDLRVNGRLRARFHGVFGPWITLKSGVSGFGRRADHRSVPEAAKPTIALHYRPQAHARYHLCAPDGLCSINSYGNRSEHFKFLHFIITYDVRLVIQIGTATMAKVRDTKEIRILTPVGMIGYGFSHELFWKAVSQGVDAIIADCGSTDSGPQKLARGSMTVSREAYVADLDTIVEACSTYKIPVLLGSAGGDGSDDHVQVFLNIVKELIEEKGYRSLNVVTINSEIDKDLIKTKLAHGQISPCSKAVPELTANDVTEATRIVGQMGLEPYVKAMSDCPDFDIIIGGRSYDPAM